MKYVQNHWERIPIFGANRALPVGVSIWGLAIGGMTVLGFHPSITISSLPLVVANGWAICTIVASLATLYGYYVRISTPLVSRSLFLHAIMALIYVVSSIAIVGFQDAGASILIYAVVSFSLACESRVLRWKCREARRHETPTRPEA